MQARPDHLMSLVLASLPSLTRPRMATEYERLMLQTDQAKAACYASMECLAAQLGELVERIDATEASLVVDVSDASDDDEIEDSLVISLATLLPPT